MSATEGAARVLAAVRAAPGRSVSAIARELDVDPSTAAYHLRRLERRRAVVARTVGRERVYYPEGVVCPLLKAHWPTLARHRAAARGVLAGPRTSQDLAALAREPLGRTRAALAALAAAGFVERHGRRYVAARDLPRCLAALERGGACGLWGRCSLSGGGGADAREGWLAAVPAEGIEPRRR